MSRKIKLPCDECSREYKIGSLIKWQGEFLCYRCRIKRWSWKIMHPKTWRSQKEIDEMEGRG